MQEFAKDFYNSQAWKNCRKAYIKSVGGLCERCLEKNLYIPGEIVHHRIPLTPEVINKPEVALNWANLMLLCRKCHAEIHEDDVYAPMRTPRRYKVDSSGKVIIISDKNTK